MTNITNNILRSSPLFIAAAIAVFGISSVHAQVYFEAECGIVGNAWSAGFDTNASESVFVGAIPDRTDATITGAQSQDELLEYQVTVPAIGTYDIYVLGQDVSGGDSLYYSLDNSTWATINNLPAGASYQWSNLETLVTGGTYQEVVTTATNEVVSIYISGREDEYQIDKFALLADDSAVPTGQGTVVGSCFDFGDAPDTTDDTTGAGDYITNITNTLTGPIHPVDQSPEVYLGSVAPDTEADALDNSTATGDDVSDEGEAQLVSAAASDAFPSLEVDDTSYSVEIDLTNNKAVDATVVAWIDFDRDGLFETGELADVNPLVTASTGNTQVTLTWTGITGLSLGSTYARFRISTDTELTTKESIDVVIDGEVEDHQINITPNAATPVCYAAYPDSFTGTSTSVIEMNGLSPTATGSQSDFDIVTNNNDANDELYGMIYTSELVLASSGSFDFQTTSDDGSQLYIDGRLVVDNDGAHGTETVSSTAISLDAGTHDIEVFYFNRTGGLNLTVEWTPTGSGGSYADLSLDLSPPSFCPTSPEFSLDYGDADAAYADAFHAIGFNDDYSLGLVGPDTETVLSSIGADADDLDNIDDEDADPDLTGLDTSYTGNYVVSMQVANAGADATLGGWIDFDGDSLFETTEYASATVTSSDTSVDLVFDTNALSIVEGSTYARFRITRETITDADADGFLASGEVEDYSLTIITPLDFGDAIDSAAGSATLDYRTELADDGPRHVLSAGLFLGDIAADDDGDASDNGAATGDDLDVSADEGVEQLLTTAQGSEFPSLAVADTSFDFDIDLTNSVGTANLYVWVDYDQSGSFDEDELASGSPISVLNGATSASIGSVPTSDAVVGNTYMRIRLTTDNLAIAVPGGDDERSYGLASDGEVEDYRIEITGLDFGDAPDSYGTDKTDDGGEGVGPSHVQIGTLYIGDNLSDLDSDGIPSASASGDDADGDDEGGFFIPVIGVVDTSYSITLPLVNNTGNAATLFGWLDFNEDGDFDVAEAVFTTVPSGALSATLELGNWTGFSVLSGSQTYLRLRLTTDASITNATSGGAAADGEVEDHLVIVGALDFGDAPDTYSTDATAGNDGAGGFDGIGPSHGINGSLYIGAVVPDGEADGQANATATGDDVADEAPFVLPFLSPASDKYTLPVTVENSLADAQLLGWIDFDGNGFFDNDEGATILVPNPTSGSVDLVWDSIPADITVGDTFVRLRLTTDASIATGDATTSSPKGPATDGEVEDHIISIATAYDYGDAPDSYGTDGTDGGEGFGPRHIISPLLYLGSFAPDAELDGQDSIDALLDDDTGTGEATIADSTDGDEGDLFVTTIQPDQTTYSLSVPLRNATGSNATLYGWLDLNQDGDFEDTNESQTTIILPGSSFGTLTFTWVSGNTSGGNGLDNGNTFLRLRLSSESALGPTETLSTDFADDGEVEDYRVQVSQLTCDLLYGIYNNGGYTRLREFDNDTVDLATTSFQSAGIGIERNYRRFYYMEWPTAANRRLFYYDPTATPSVDVDTGASIATSGNYNRMAFSYGGRGVIVESSSFDVYLFDPTISGTGQSITSAIDMSNVGTILGDGGDLAFDRDDNLYMLTYDTGANEFYLYEIRFTLVAGGASIEIPDMVLTGSPQTTYEATAFLLLTEANPTGAQIGGMAFNFDNLIYLQGSGANTTFTWDVGITAAGGAGAIQGPTDDEPSSDLASCIYPYIRAIIEPVKTVVNSTSGGAGYVPGDTLEYTISVRNSGGFPSFDTVFQDDIQPGTTYVPNSTRMNGNALTDTGGLMPFVVEREIHTDGAADGTVLADITPGVVGDNEVVITYRVQVDSDGSNTEVCNQGFVDYEANLVTPIPTNDPSTGTADDPTCLSQTSGFKVSGTLYEDANVDGIQSTSEPGIGSVAMVLYDSVASSCESVLTNANGFYEFPSVNSGPKTVYELSGAAVPSPATCPPNALGNDPSGFLSSTTNSTSIYVVNADITDLDFGDVRLPSLTPDLESVVEPGGVQTYSHIFRAPTNGSVSFAALSTSSPVLAGWTSTIYQDLDCSGDLTASDFIVLSGISMVSGESICLLNRVFSPTQAIAGNTLSTELTATFDYDGALVGDQDVEAQDLTTVLDDGESALQLTKRVRNITDTSSEFDVVAGISNAAKPGDRLRYEISFANTGVGNISDVDIYDAIPAYTELAEVLAVDCTYAGPAGAPLTAIVPPAVMDSCSLITPSGGANAAGYGGTLHWQLSGVLQPGEEGLIVFTVDVD